jgi:hypothetical protein
MGEIEFVRGSFEIYARSESGRRGSPSALQTATERLARLDGYLNVDPEDRVMRLEAEFARLVLEERWLLARFLAADSDTQVRIARADQGGLGLPTDLPDDDSVIRLYLDRHANRFRHVTDRTSKGPLGMSCPECGRSPSAATRRNLIRKANVARAAGATSVLV